MGGLSSRQPHSLASPDPVYFDPDDSSSRYHYYRAQRNKDTAIGTGRYSTIHSVLRGRPLNNIRETPSIEPTTFDSPERDLPAFVLQGNFIAATIGLVILLL